LWHHILLLQHVVLGELIYVVVLEPTDCKFSCFLEVYLRSLIFLNVTFCH
jgi:hypothetical protein